MTTQSRFSRALAARFERMPTADIPVFPLVLFSICALIVREFANLMMRNRGFDPEVAKHLSWLLVPIVFWLLMLPYWSPTRKLIVRALALRSITWRMVLASIAVALLLKLAQRAAILAMDSIEYVPADPLLPFAGPIIGAGCTEPYVVLLSVVVLGLLTPFMEEIVHRALLLSALLPKGPFFALVISSIFFGLCHVTGMILPAMIIGLYLALLYLSTRTLWAPVMTHVTFNILGILEFGCTQLYWNPQNGTKEIAAISILVVGLSLFAAAMIVWKYQPRE